MRATDERPSPHHERRVRRSLGGTVVAVGGVAFAILALWRGEMSHVPALIGFGAALIGAGMVDPGLLVQQWKEWRR